MLSSLFERLFQALWAAVGGVYKRQVRVLSRCLDGTGHYDWSIAPFQENLYKCVASVTHLNTAGMEKTSAL